MFLYTIDSQYKRSDDPNTHQVDEIDDQSVEVIDEFANDGHNYYVVRPVKEVLIETKSIDDNNKYNTKNKFNNKKYRPIR